MEKLTVKNFLNIKDIEFNLSKINIIIGQQASGKSILAKLVYFFKDFFIKYRSSIQNKQKKAEFDKSIITTFKIIFPEYSWKNQEFQILYEFNSYSVALNNQKSDDKKSKLSLIYSEHLVKVRRKILSEYNKKTIEYAENNPEKIIEEYYNTIFSKYVLRDVNSLDLITFIPAGRSFFANLQNNIFSFLSENILIDYFLKEFGSAYERVKNLYHVRKFIHQLKPSDSIDELINQIIVGNYSYEKDQDWILYTNETNKNRRTNLSHSSSGQQEALPMTLILAILPFISSTTRLFIIEEPEAHLFPTSQKHIVSLISQVFNTTEKKHKFFITTHSPYILTAFNNLIQAGNTLKALREKPEQNDLLKDLFKIVPENQTLDINDVAAYTIKNGMIESLINEENNLIDTNIIDDVSNEFSQVFEKLIELEFGE
ncbi:MULTISPECIES: AAA family ATPase [Nostocales]|uniref:ATP-binding protein n=1 Tax=Dolichospermum flos-aquae UHCC 0037 TaxID=2590026 RepID=A0ACC7S0D2_DOLFA|nr:MULTISPECIES: ATP-binding protein [Nostocales]MBO1063979.1 ATP-binding protein [Anabaena sp. 54]MTJ41848.1 ATP-binding protein [Dolichospermum flos-aquae UHCC 0037]